MKRYVKASANNAIVLNNDDKLAVASQVSLNIEGEWDAIRGYDLLLQFLDKYNDQESIDHVREIISDEKNHAMLLRDILLKYDGDIPVAKD